MTADKDKTHAELLKELEYLRAENTFLKKRNALIQAQEVEQVVTTRLISKFRQTYLLDVLLKTRYATSIYFYHQQSSGQADKYADVKQQIKAIYRQHKWFYGYHRITLALRHLGHLLKVKRKGLSPMQYRTQSLIAL